MTSTQGLTRVCSLLASLAIVGSAGAQTTVPVTAPPAGSPPVTMPGTGTPAVSSPMARPQGTGRDTTPPFTVGPPIRRIATATAVSTEPLNSITSVLQLSDGRVLVNDGTRRRLLVMDTTLKLQSVILDSIAETSATYGTRAGAMFSYRGDTTIFIDPAAYAMLVIDPSLHIARVRSIPRSQDVFYLTSSFYGYPGFDARGRLVYRIEAQPAPPKVPPPAGVPYFPPQPDSAFIVGIDLDSRKLDTLGVLKQPKSTMIVKQTAEGSFSILSTVNPLPSTDEWAVLSDGRIAFVRGRDYRVEWRAADGTMSSSQKIPFDWQRMTDESKQRMIDSVRKAQERSVMTSWVSSMIRWSNMYAKPYPKDFKVPEDYVLSPGMPKDWILPPGAKFPENYIFACPPGVNPVMPPTVTGSLTTGAPAQAGSPAAGAPAAGAPVAPALPSCLPAPSILSGGFAPPPPTRRDIYLIPAEDLPDYKPPFAQSSVRADGDGNLWVRIIPPKPIPGGPVYDIINPAGELVDRLQVPNGYTIVGYGAGKVVYLSVRDAKGLHLARVRLK